MEKTKGWHCVLTLKRLKQSLEATVEDVEIFM